MHWSDRTASDDMILIKFHSGWSFFFVENDQFCVTKWLNQGLIIVIPIIISDLIIHRIDRFPQLIDHHNRGWLLHHNSLVWSGEKELSERTVLSFSALRPCLRAQRRGGPVTNGDGGKVVLSERVWQDNVKHGVHPSRREVISEGPLEVGRPLANLTECPHYTRLRERARPGGSAWETAVHRACLQSTSSVSESLSPVSLHRKWSTLQKSETSLWTSFDSERYWSLCHVLTHTYDYSIPVITSI